MPTSRRGCIPTTDRQTAVAPPVYSSVVMVRDTRSKHTAVVPAPPRQLSTPLPPFSTIIPPRRQHTVRSSIKTRGKRAQPPAEAVRARVRTQAHTHVAYLSAPPARASTHLSSPLAAQAIQSTFVVHLHPLCVPAHDSLGGARWITAPTGNLIRFECFFNARPATTISSSPVLPASPPFPLSATPRPSSSLRGAEATAAHPRPCLSLEGGQPIFFRPRSQQKTKAAIK